MLLWASGHLGGVRWPIYLCCREADGERERERGVKRLVEVHLATSEANSYTVERFGKRGRSYRGEHGWLGRMSDVLLVN